MKNKLLLVCLGMVALFGCSQVTNVDVSAQLPSGFEFKTVDEINFGEVYKGKDKETGCYFIFGTSRNNSSTTISMEQIFIEKNGVSVPYCDEKKE